MDATREYEPDHMSPGGTNPFKPNRTQDDGLGDIVSAETATEPDPRSLTRQEFAQDADINILLSRFGVNNEIRSNPIYGAEIDYNLTLQEALNAVDSARSAVAHVPEELRQKYRTWTDVLNASETGEYQKDLQDLADKKADAKARSDAAAQQKKLAEKELPPAE